jgi:hypothetical protein
MNDVKAVPAVAPANHDWLTGRTFLIAAVALAILSIPVAVASWVYERQRALPIAALSCGCVAVTWQYIVFGLIIGAAAAMFLIVLAIFARFIPT